MSDALPRRPAAAGDDALITVVTPVRNGAATIEAAIASVQAQSHDALEHLVVDDGSDDDTVARVERCAVADPRLRLLRNAGPGGAAGARNTAIEQARGRWLAFLDADDLWAPHKLALQLELARSSGAALVYSAYDLIDAFGRPLGRARIVPEQVDHGELLKCNVIGCLTAFLDRRQVEDPRMPLIRQRQDWALWLRVVRETGRPALAVPEVLASLRLHPDSLSANKLRSSWYNVLMQVRCEGIALPRALMNAATHAVRSRRGWRRLPVT